MNGGDSTKHYEIWDKFLFVCFALYECEHEALSAISAVGFSIGGDPG